MRVGNNPEKNKNKLIRYKLHRIIIPVYIPNEKDTYFDNLFTVFKTSIDSLLKTIDKEHTKISVINNACNKIVSHYINELLLSNYIDKHIHYSSNMGKVNTILSEAKGSYEDFITIADADVFYYNGWQLNSLYVFKKFKKVGVVAPLPCTYLAYYNNISYFSNILKIKKKKLLLSKESCESFGESVGWTKERVLNEERWKKPQYYMKNKFGEVFIGAGHFIATYRADILHTIPFKKNTYVFKNGDEYEFLDEPIDKLGYYRVSLTKSFVYHLGNTIPKWVDSVIYKKQSLNTFNLPQLKANNIPFLARVFFYKLWRKLNKNH